MNYSIIANNREISHMKHLETYKNLIEIMRNSEKLKELHNQIDQENKRIDFIKEQIRSRETENEDLRSHIIQLRNIMATSKDDNEIFELMLNEEKCLNQIKNNKDFISGAEESRVEISKEVEETILNTKPLLNSLNERNDYLWSDIPAFPKQGLLSLIKRGKNPPFVFTEGRLCLGCRLMMDQSQKSNLESLNHFEFCQQCERLFIPEEVKRH